MTKLYAYLSYARKTLFFAGVAGLQLMGAGVSAQQFTAGRLVVERVGNGAPQSGSGTPIYLDEFTTGGTPGITITLPTTTSGSLNRTVESGYAISGMLTRSEDGKYLAVPGYDAPVGTPNVTTSMLNKVITRVDATGALTSTVVTDASAFSANAFRGVATSDGSSYWLSGAGNGPVYVSHQGSTTPVAGTEVSTTSTDNRNTMIFQGQLYASTGVGGSRGVYEVGLGLPTTSGNTMTVDVNLGASADPYGYTMVVNGGVTIMYITDYTNKLLYKYRLNGAVWMPQGTASINISGVPAGFYAITGYVTGLNVRLFATTSNLIGSNSRIVTFTDATGPLGTISGSFGATTLAGPTTNMVYRGISFVPFTVSSITSAVPAVCYNTGTNVTISGTPGAVVTYQANGVTQPAATLNSSGNYTFATGALSSNATYNLLSVTDGFTTQVLTGTLTVSVNPLPAISAGSNTSICIFSSTTLTASGGVSYTWAPSTGLSSVTGTSVTASPLGITNYTVTGTDINGCVNRSSVTVSVNSLPAIGGGSNVPICIGTSTTLTATGGASYTWAPGGSLSATTGTSVTANPTSTTQYTVTGTNANGCVNRGTVTVSVNPLPTIGVTADPTICSGQATPLAATGALTYTWSPAAGLSSTIGPNVMASPTITTTYTVTGISAQGCVNSTTVTVFVNSLPPISGGTSATMCIGASTTLSATGGLSYTWSPAAGLSSTAGASVTANPMSTVVYTVTGVDGNGCVGRSTVTVNINPLPTIVASDNVIMCFGQSTTLSATGGISYTWSPTASLSSPVGTSVVASPTVTTTYTVTGTDINGCMNNGTVRVTIVPLPTITTTPGGPMCAGGNVILNAAGASSYTWAPATALSSTAGSSVTASPASTATYTVTGISSLGCVSSTTVTVSVNALPVVSAGPNVAICRYSNTLLTASGAATYSWAVTPGLSTYTGATTTANPTTTTTYTVTGTSTVGCVNRASVTVSVNPLPTVVAGPSAAICRGFSTGMTASGANTYTWSPATGLSTTIGNSVVASPTVTTTYTVSGTDSNGCVNTTTVWIPVYALPLVTVTAGMTICEGSHTPPLTATGAVSYTWAPATALSATTGSAVTASPVANTTYTVTGTNSLGCSNYATVTVTVNPSPTPYAVTGGGGYCLGGPGMPVGMAGSQTGMNYQLFRGTTPVPGIIPGTGSAFSFGSMVVTGTYTVIGTNPINGCSRSMTGSAIVSINPGPALVNVTGGGVFCAGGAGVHVGITGSALGANYQLYVDGTAVDTPRTGVGSSIDFGLQTTPGIYTVIATDAITGCTRTMTGSATISTNPLPALYSVTGGGHYCSGGSGVHIGIIGSQIGMRYQVYQGVTPVNGSLIGMATALDFGLFTIPGVYKIKATSSTTGCTTWMNDSAVVSIDAVPAITGTLYIIPKTTTTTLSVTPAGGTWSSHTPSVATVDSFGRVTGVSIGSSQISYTLPSGCYDTYLITVSPHVGFSNVAVNGNCTLVPNPNNGSFTLKGTINVANEDAQIVITNVTGQVVYTAKAAVRNGELNVPITMSNAAPGMYVLSVKTPTGSQQLKFVVE